MPSIRVRPAPQTLPVFESTDAKAQSEASKPTIQIAKADRLSQGGFLRAEMWTSKWTPTGTFRIDSDREGAGLNPSGNSTAGSSASRRFPP